jgi:hypothetical protein
MKLLLYANLGLSVFIFRQEHGAFVIRSHILMRCLKLFVIITWPKNSHSQRLNLKI